MGEEEVLEKQGCVYVRGACSGMDQGMIEKGGNWLGKVMGSCKNLESSGAILEEVSPLKCVSQRR